MNGLEKSGRTWRVRKVIMHPNFVTDRGRLRSVKLRDRHFTPVSSIGALNSAQGNGFAAENLCLASLTSKPITSISPPLCTHPRLVNRGNYRTYCYTHEKNYHGCIIEQNLCDRAAMNSVAHPAACGPPMSARILPNSQIFWIVQSRIKHGSCWKLSTADRTKNNW